MSEPYRALPNEWIGKLFQRFRSLYGNKVDTVYGTADQEDLLGTWARRLGQFAREDLLDALEVVPREHTDYPPTLPQFVSLCRDARNRRAETSSKLDYSREPVDPEVANAMRDSGRDLSRPPPDPRKWARDILEKHEAGIRVPAVALEFAREALR